MIPALMPLILQKLYKGHLHVTKDSEGVPIVLKHRFEKRYRHPTLDAGLTKARVAGEARALLKCLRCVYTLGALSCGNACC